MPAPTYYVATWHGVPVATRSEPLLLSDLIEVIRVMSPVLAAHCPGWSVSIRESVREGGNC